MPQMATFHMGRRTLLHIWNLCVRNWAMATVAFPGLVCQGSFIRHPGADDVAPISLHTHPTHPSHTHLAQTRHCTHTAPAHTLMPEPFAILGAVSASIALTRTIIQTIDLIIGCCTQNTPVAALWLEF